MSVNRSLILSFQFISLSLVISFPASAFGQSPEAPVVLDSGAGGCVPSQDICGDGVDQDCDGTDLLCPGPDQDRDGYTTNDCDDTNRHVYPGISVPCSATDGAGTKTCQASGAFTACSTTPLCEAVGTGRCFYISALTGSDSNPGSFASPWKTYKNIISYYGGAGQPSTWVQLRAGDVVYFMSGLYRDLVSYNGQTFAFFIRFLNGTPTARVTFKAYPGAHPIITPSGPSEGIYFLQSSNLLLEGFEVNRATLHAVRFAESSNIEARNLWVHDTDGEDNDNLAGVYANVASNIEVHHSLIHDNYDRTNADTGGNKTENSRNVVLFGGGTARLHHNVIFQTPQITAQKTGGCITYKHSAVDAGAIFEVAHNVFWNCYHPVIGSGTYGTRIHHNLILNSDPIEIRDFGGPTHNEDIIIEYNTIIGTKALSYQPSDTWGPIGQMTFRNNVITDTHSYNFEDAMVTVLPYGSDALYTTVVNGGKMSYSNNCYYNPSVAPVWAIFARNGGGYGTLGAMYSPLTAWQAVGYDSGSSSVNPALDVYQRATAAACQGKGWSAP